MNWILSVSLFYCVERNEKKLDFEVESDGSCRATCNLNFAFARINYEIPRLMKFQLFPSNPSINLKGCRYRKVIPVLKKRKKECEKYKRIFLLKKTLSLIIQCHER